MTKETKLKSVKVSRLLEIDEEQNKPIGFEVLAGLSGIHNKLTSSEINRPGLTLSGFFDHFAPERMQIFGKGEVAFIQKLVKDNRIENIEKFFGYNIPVCVVTNGLSIPQIVLNIAESRNIPLLRTSLSSEAFIGLINTILSDIFAPHIMFHGNFLSIYSIGVLLIGDSGVGKSESALGLVERGHKFICDDMVKIKKMRTPRGYELIGEPYVDYGPFIEIRGIGIINVSQYYGEGRVLYREKLGMIIKLREWKSSQSYDRLGLEENYLNIMGIEVPIKEIPVSGGRNIPLLVEIAAYREIMRRLGYNSAEELDKKIISFMKREKEVV